ncbi:MAG: hypothetical protein EBX85_00320 [Actinobacteria bacterium]|nr:hypothetical protein [Actinomycetota bacterium]
MEFDFATERIVKSSERVRDLAEVFTPNPTVQEMLELFPKKVWTTHPSQTFLEPACGDGNFLVAILDRKLEQISFELEHLENHVSHETTLSLAFEALASIYAVDISKDNIVGGTPGHERGARTRVIERFIDWIEFETGIHFDPDSREYSAAKWIIEHNIIIGNMLPLDAQRNSTGRDLIPIIEYEFDPQSQRVSLRKTTLGEISYAAEQDTAATPTLFAPEQPQEFWTGSIFDIADADRISAPKLRGPARNGVAR